MESGMRQYNKARSIANPSYNGDNANLYSPPKTLKDFYTYRRY